MAEEFEEKPLVEPDSNTDVALHGLWHYVWLLVTSPITLNLKLLSRMIRPFSRQLIPLAITLSILPVLVVLSISAGFYVWKNVAVGWKTSLFLQYGDGVMPYAEALLPRLAVQQPYDVSLELVVPVSEPNIALGNFMTSLTLSTTSNKTLAFTRRPALMIPGSAWSLTSMFRTSGTVRVRVPLMHPYVASTSNVIAKLDLGRNDAWKTLGSGEGRELSVISATLIGSLIHEGFRGLITRFPLVFSFLASATFFLISSVTAGVLLFPTFQLFVYQDSDTEDTPVKRNRRTRLNASRPLSNDDRRLRRPKTITASRSRSTRNPRTRPVHETDAPITLMEPSEPSVPLRRRRSRLELFSESE